MRSIMAASTAATAQQTALSRMRPASTSRRSGSSCLLSLSPRMGRSGERITAPAKTAPNNDPLPTSSTPAMAEKPRARSSRSNVASQRSFAALPGTAKLLAFLEARGLALQRAQIVQLGPAHFSRADHVDAIDHARVKRENAL